MYVKRDLNENKHLGLDLITFIISFLVLGINYSQLNNSLFASLLILIFSPTIIMVNDLFSGKMIAEKNCLLRVLSFIELGLLVISMAACILGILGILKIQMVENTNINKMILSLVVDADFVFFPGAFVSAKVIFVVILIITALKTIQFFAQRFSVAMRKAKNYS